jgi:pilus assembly protein CpaF
MIKLTITEKGGEPKALSFDKDEVTIGRVSGNDIVLPKGNVSKRHSKLALRGAGQIEISDLKSTNGTYVNGRKIGDPMLLSGTDRVYVGDFLITVDGLPVGDGPSSSRRLPVPPPPPPARTGSSASRLPVAEETTGMGGEDEEEQSGGVDEEDAPLAARPPRSSSRLPVPPPPPPPRRPPTPLASAAFDEEAMGEEPAAPPRAVEPGEDATGGNAGAGLFERSARDDHSAFDGAGGRPSPTGRRPGAALPSEAFGVAPEAAASQPGVPPEGVAAEGLDALLGDPAVAHIVISGPDAVYVDRGSGPAASPTGLGDLNAVADTLWRIANTAVPPPPPENPVVDVRLPDGTHLQAVFPPASPRGVVAAIRKPALAERALADLCPPGAKELETLLEAAVTARRNLICTGDADAVTALLAALAGAIPAERRAVSIGGAPAKARAGWTELAPTADMPALARVAASLRGDHLLAAEPVGVEAADLLVGAARGQEGLALALPARTAGEALARLTALSAAALGAGGAAAAPLVASTIDLVVVAVTSDAGGARVVEIAEPAAAAPGAPPSAEAVATWRSDGGRRGGDGGKLEVDGVSARLGAAFAAAGMALPSSLVRK